MASDKRAEKRSNFHDRRGASDPLRIRSTALAKALALRNLSAMDRKELEAQLVQVQGIIDAMDSEIAELQEEIAEKNSSLFKLQGVRKQYGAVMRALRNATGEDWSDALGVPPTRMTIVDAIDWILTDSDKPVTRSDISQQLATMLQNGVIQKSPTDNSLRAMLSQYSEGRGWRKIMNMNMEVVYYKPGAKLDANGNQIPF